MIGSSRGSRSTSTAEQVPERAKARMPLSAGIIRLPKSGMTALASILDFGGDQRGRPFPICFYVGVPTSQWPGPTSDRVLAAANVAEKLLALRNEVASFVNVPGHFETVFGGREADLTALDNGEEDKSWQAPAKAVAMTDWFEGVRSILKTSDQTAWLQLAAECGDNIARLESKDFEPTLRFPLAWRIAAGAQIAGWISWLGSRLDLERRTVSLVVSGELDRGPGHLAVIARDIVPDDFLLFTAQAGSLSYLDDLSELEASDQNDDSKVSVDSSGSGASLSASWFEFVKG